LGIGRVKYDVCKRPANVYRQSNIDLFFAHLWKNLVKLAPDILDITNQLRGRMVTNVVRII